LGLGVLNRPAFGHNGWGGDFEGGDHVYWARENQRVGDSNEIEVRFHGEVRYQFKTLCLSKKKTIDWAKKGQREGKTQRKKRKNEKKNRTAKRKNPSPGKD